MNTAPGPNGNRVERDVPVGDRYRELPQYDRTKTYFDRAIDTAASAMDAVRRNDVTASTASDIVRGARHGLIALLEWNRVADEEASFAELIRRAENLAAGVATPARVIAPIEAAAGKDTLSQPEHENVRSAAFTLRNLLEIVASQLPPSISERRPSPELPS